MNYTDGRAAMVVLKDWLQTRLNTVHAADFGRWNGAICRLRDEKIEGRDSRPVATLDMERDEKGRDNLVRAYDCTINIEVTADEFTGANNGKRPPTPNTSDTLLSRAIRRSIDEGRDELTALGLYKAKMVSNRESTREAPGAANQNLDPHRITFTYFIPGDD